MIGDTVRCRVARPQDPGERFAGRIRETEHRREPEPALVIRAGPGPFSEWICTSDASMSNTTSPVPVVAAIRRHIRVRVTAVLVLRSARTPGVIARIVRYSVESDATGPNRRGWETRNSMSEHASPPAASINIAWVNTTSRSCVGARSPAHGIAVDRVGPSPILSAKRPNACRPAWATTCVPPASTTTFNVLLRFTLQVPFRLGLLVLQHLQNPLRQGHLRGYATYTITDP